MSQKGTSTWETVRDMSSFATTIATGVVATAAVFYPPIATFLDVQTMKGEVHTMKGEVHTVKDEVHTVKDEVHTVKDEVHTVKDEVHEIKNLLEEQRKHRWF